MSDTTENEMLTDLCEALEADADDLGKAMNIDAIAEVSVLVRRDLRRWASRLREHLSRTPPPQTGPLCSCGSPSCHGDHPLPQPNLSGGVPMCQASCSYYDSYRASGEIRGIPYSFGSANCRYGDKQHTSEGDDCRPYNRYLLALSLRRCDECPQGKKKP
jgi:hypothetical protein